MKTAEQFITEKFKIDRMPNELTFFHEKLFALMEEYASQFKYDFSKSCKCGEKRTGETWCCNVCGLPVKNSSQSLPELPKITDEEIEKIILNRYHSELKKRLNKE